MEYLFRIKGCPKGEWETQLAKALDARTEYEIRQKQIGLFTKTDDLKSRKKTEAKRKNRVIRQKVLGCLLIVLGLVSIVLGFINRSEIITLLTAGVLSAVFGIFSLLPQKEYISKEDQEGARLLLEQRRHIEPATVRFDETGLFDEGERVEYSQLDLVIEAQDIFLFCWDDNVLALWKKEMIHGSAAGLGAFLRQIEGLAVIES